MARTQRRRATIALGMSGSRDTLVQDLAQERSLALQQQAHDESEARYAAAKEKADKQENWAKEQNRLRDLSQQFQDNNITLKDLQSEVSKSKEKFPDNTDAIDSLQRQAVRNRDVQQFNNYVQGGQPIEEFKAFVDSRKKDGGDLSNLNNLLAQANANEDKLQFQQYSSGAMTFDQLQQYAATRSKEGGDLSKLNGYVAQAQTNENKITDQNYAAMYNAGSMPASDYKSYLQRRAEKTVDPKEATAIRGAIHTVETNETMKAADEVRAEYQAGQIDGGAAVSRLMGIRGSSNDATTQTSILNLVGSIQKADQAKASAGASSSSAAINRIQSSMTQLATDAKTEYGKDMAAIDQKVAKATDKDYAKLSDLSYIAHQQLKNGLEMAGNNSPDPAWAQHYATQLKAAETAFSTHLFEMATTISDNMTRSAVNGTTGFNLDKAGDAAKFLIQTASQNPYMSHDDRMNLVQAGEANLNTAMDQWKNSAQGIEFRDFVNNRTNELMSNKGAGMANLAKMLGVDPATVGDPRGLVEKLLMNNPDIVRAALANTPGTRGFADVPLDKAGQKKFIEGVSSDDFSKQVATLTSTVRELTKVHDELTQKYDITGLNAEQTAEAGINAPLDANGRPTDWRKALIAGDRRDQENVNRSEHLYGQQNPTYQEIPAVSPKNKELIDKGMAEQNAPEPDTAGPLPALASGAGALIHNYLGNYGINTDTMFGRGGAQGGPPDDQGPNRGHGQQSPISYEGLAQQNSPADGVPDETGQNPMDVLQQIMALRASEWNDSQPQSGFTPPASFNLNPLEPNDSEPFFTPPAELPPVEAVSYGPSPDAADRNASYGGDTSAPSNDRRVGGSQE